MTEFTQHQKYLAASRQYSALRSAGFSASALRSAGFSASALRSAGFSASALLSAGFSASEVLSAGFSASALRALLKDVPVLEKPYSKIFADIQESKRLLKQSTFGPEVPTNEKNICNTAMCTAGHLVNLAGAEGWKLKSKYNFPMAAALIHEKAHPGWPCQDFGAIPDDFALAYIETMAEHEKNGTVPEGALEA